MTIDLLVIAANSSIVNSKEKPTSLKYINASTPPTLLS